MLMCCLCAVKHRIFGLNSLYLRLSSWETTPVWVHAGPHQQLGQTPQNPAELHTPEQQHTHQRHRHSCQCCPGGWRCRRRALRGGRAISSPRSCSRCACRPAPVGLWWWRMGFRCSVSRSCCCTWSFWCSLQEPRDKDTLSTNTDVRFFTQQLTLIFLLKKKKKKKLARAAFAVEMKIIVILKNFYFFCLWQVTNGGSNPSTKGSVWKAHLIHNSLISLIRGLIRDRSEALLGLLFTPRSPPLTAKRKVWETKWRYGHWATESN